MDRTATDSLYTMILVDDEDEVRGRISSRIGETSGFTVVGTAGNGYDALELIEEHTPHVVLTDIKMPYIDGIELAQTIRRDYPTTRIAFITGYNEFDYAREAIKLRARGYLTKPLTEEAIRDFLRDLKRDLDDEFEHRYSRDMIRKQYEQSVPLLIGKQPYVSAVIAHQFGMGQSRSISRIRRRSGVAALHAVLSDGRAQRRALGRHRV